MYVYVIYMYVYVINIHTYTYMYIFFFSSNSILLTQVSSHYWPEYIYMHSVLMSLFQGPDSKTEASTPSKVRVPISICGCPTGPWDQYAEPRAHLPELA